jgi:hypothetical protein
MYPEAVSEILVFKTNIARDEDLVKVASVINNDSRIRQWNVDRDDIDHVLRIEATQIVAPDVISMVHKAGFECEELPD